MNPIDLIPKCLRFVSPSDCSLLVIAWYVARPGFNTPETNSNYGRHVASVLLGLSQIGKSRASVVALYQIEAAVNRAGRFHRALASARKQSGRMEIDGLRSYDYYDLGEFDQKGGCLPGSVPKLNYSTLSSLLTRSGYKWMRTWCSITTAAAMPRRRNGLTSQAGSISGHRDYAVYLPT
jgi:hypothetical protein